MSSIAGKKSALTWAVHISVVLLVALWLFPTVGLFISSFRSSDQIATSGWWSAMFTQEQNLVLRTGNPSMQTRDGSVYVIDSNLFSDNGANTAGDISAWGVSSRAISDFAPGDTADLGDGARVTVQSNGDYRLESDAQMSGSRGPRVFVTAATPPEFTIHNYRTVLFTGSTTDSMAKAFFNTLTVTIPATIIRSSSPPSPPMRWPGCSFPAGRF